LDRPHKLAELASGRMRPFDQIVILEYVRERPYSRKIADE
jgi:hypothetical protein